MNPKKIALKELKAAGFILDREGANHAVYYSESLGGRITISRSSHFDDDDLQMIRKEIKKLKERKGGK